MKTIRRPGKNNPHHGQLKGPPQGMKGFLFFFGFSQTCAFLILHPALSVLLAFFRLPSSLCFIVYVT